jgi:hypothetical protein
MTEELQIRLHGDPSRPTLVYLPGLHGDWTLVGGFRHALGDRVRFVEFTYPRTLTWSLDDYARAVEKALEGEAISSGWLLGESFGSQVVWPLLDSGRFQVEGVILAGGFARHPIGWGVRLAEWTVGAIPMWLITGMLFAYAKIARLRFWRSPETLAGVHEFLARRTELDRKAIVHRLRLIKENDPCAVARNTSVPIYAISGLFDPIVQWWWVRPWLKQNCSSLQATRMFWGADHTVLATAARGTAEQVVAWMKANRIESAGIKRL